MTLHRLVFYWCFVLAIVGFVWTSVLVRDRPHKSLEVADMGIEMGMEKSSGGDSSKESHNVTAVA